MRRFSAVKILSAVFAAVLVALPGAAFAVDAQEASTDQSAAPPKRLHSIPLDGALEDVPVAPRVVRELTALRPKDDLIICIAGCSPGRDLVIYAKPQEELVDGKSVTNNVPVKATPSTDAPTYVAPSAAAPSPAPATTPLAKANDDVAPADGGAKPEAKSDADAQAKATAGDASTPDVINAQPDADSANGRGATSAFEPTVDLPKGAVGDDAASEVVGNEPSSDSSSDPMGEAESAPSDQPANDDKNR